MSTTTNPSTTAVLKAAIETAYDRAHDLIGGIYALTAMAGNEEQPEIEGDALRWVAERLRIQADDIQTDLDHAQRALAGAIYNDSEARFHEKIDAGEVS